METNEGIKESQMLNEQANKINKSDNLLRGSPVFFFICFVILMIVLITTIYIRSKNVDTQFSTHQSRNNFKRIQNDNSHNWEEVVIPPPNQIQSNTIFKYPEILTKENLSDLTPSFNRDKLQIECSRFIGLNPSDSSFSQPKVLVVGSNSATGSAVIRKFKSQNISFISIKNYIDFDFSSPYAKLYFSNITLIGAIIVHQPPLFRFANTDGSSYIQEIIANYTDGLMSFLHELNIPIVYAVTRPYIHSNSNVDYCFGAKLVFLPHLVDSTEIYDTENILLRAVRECQIVGHSTIVTFEPTYIESITAEDAATFLIDQMNNFQPGRITLNGMTNISIKKAIKMVVGDKCNITFRRSSHKFTKVKTTNNHFIVNKNVNSLIRDSFDNYKEKEESAYLSIVVTGRNDHFANGFEERVQCFINNLAKSFQTVPTASFELIFVDYATNHSQNPYLYDVFNWAPEILKRTRSIIVPSSFHDKISTKLNTKTPFLEYVAKNIGTYRASGEFVLTMNPDSILSNSFFECIAGRNLNEGVLYQTVRFCMEDEYLHSSTVDEIIQVNEEPWITKKYHFSDYYDNERKSMRLYRSRSDFDRYLFRSGAGDFLLLSKKLWNAIGGFHEMGFNTHVDNLFNLKMLKLAMGFTKTFLPYPIIHQEHPHLSPKFGMVDNLITIYYQYLIHGRTNATPYESDRLDWGYSNETFQEIQH